MLHEITPVILTYNEAPNIGRTLSMLEWARDIVIVDSGSTDDTVAIARRHPQVRVFERPFDVLAKQWNYAIEETGISSEWILALDADYVLTPDLVEEVRNARPGAEITGFWTPFVYCIFGAPLRASLYPPKITLFRKSRGRHVQDGHMEKLVLSGDAGRLRSFIRHDDRKPFSRWLASQSNYMQSEVAKLRSTPYRDLSMADRVRRTIVLGPLVVFFYTYFYKRNVLDGRAGLHYSIQRTIAELILSAYLLEDRLCAKPRPSGLETVNHKEAS
jgi:glycosyltransferase involved in cell wall biosynthesis